MTIRHLTLTSGVLALLALVALPGCGPDPVGEDPLLAEADDPGAAMAPPTLYHANVRSVEDLEVLLAATTVERGRLLVPSIAPVRLPEDLDRLAVEERKSYFFQTLLPLVVHENARVAAQRKRLLEILDPARTLPLTTAETRYVHHLADEYGVLLDEPLDPGIVRSALLGRVDVIPVPLALAQAAIESAWGLSRFAQDGNALFGQWTFDPSRPGIVPSGRPEGADYRIEAFPSIHASIRGYMRNLNTHRAYREFRTLRLGQRQAARPLDSLALAGTLHRYSSRGEEYVAELRAIIRQNDLGTYRNARLAPAGTDLVARFAVTTVREGGPIALLVD